MSESSKENILREIDRVQLASIDGDGPVGAIYFIVCPDTKRCKIGFTRGHPAKRLASLQTGSPSELSLVAIHPGTVQTERALHEKFAASRLHGEWFEITDQLRAYLVVTVWATAEINIRAGQKLPSWVQVGIETTMDSLGVIGDSLAKLLEADRE